MRGVCLDALNPTASPTVDKLKSLRIDFVRLVATFDPRFFAYADKLNAAGIRVAVVLTGESFQTDDYASEAAEYAERVPYASPWLIANEWNIDGNASWPPGGDDAFVAVWSQTAPTLPAPCYIGGMFSEPDLLAHLARVWPLLEPLPDGIDLHPYLETSAEVLTLLHDAREAFQVPLAVMEWNDSVPSEIGPFEALLEDLTDASCWIPWCTEQLAGELPGLYRNNRLTAVGKAYRASLQK